MVIHKHVFYTIIDIISHVLCVLINEWLPLGTGRAISKTVSPQDTCAAAGSGKYQYLQECKEDEETPVHLLPYCETSRFHPTPNNCPLPSRCRGWATVKGIR